MRLSVLRLAVCLSLATGPLWAQDKLALSPGFPKPESQGGWKSALPEQGDPNEKEKQAIAGLGMHYERLQEAWEYNQTAAGPTGLVVIRKGVIVGEWYRDCDRTRQFNIYSSSKAYTSLAYGLLLAESENAQLPGGRKLTLDTKVCCEEWLSESLPLSDPRKAEITVRHLLQMASGVGSEQLAVEVAPFEIALGKTEDSPFKTLKAAPGEHFHYSNAGLAHLVLLFPKAAGQDLFPYLKERVFDRVGMENIAWNQIGGKDGKLGPLSQGYSGVMTSPREHARFCYLALHRGKWQDEQIVPAAHYEFAWAPSSANPTYGGQWWLEPRHKDAPKDLVQTAGAFHNHGYVVPSLDLVFVRLGEGREFPEKDFAQQLVSKVLAAVVSPSEKFAKEISAYEAADRQAPPPHGAILFIGSSSTRLWKTLSQDFPDRTVVNRGFGGSTIADVTYFADRVVLPYRPKQIVLQAGSNDIHAGKSPEQVAADFQAFVAKVRATLPETRISFQAINPAPVRWEEAERQQHANRLIKALIDAGENLDYIDTWTPFLGTDGQPRAELFVSDRLHQNAEGYKLRTAAVRPFLQ